MLTSLDVRVVEFGDVLGSTQIWLSNVGGNGEDGNKSSIFSLPFATYVNVGFGFGGTFRIGGCTLMC